jgi:hypothetical protein
MLKEHSCALHYPPPLLYGKLVAEDGGHNVIGPVRFTAE